VFLYNIFDLMLDTRRYILTELFATTGESVAHIVEQGDTWNTTLLLKDSHAQCLALDKLHAGTIYVGTHGKGVWKSKHNGQSWHDTELPQEDVFSIAVSPVDGAVYAGCEPSMLFRSEDGGQSWQELSALRSIPSAPTWSFPPRPWTSHVRWIAPNPHDAALLLVGIELGGLMYSSDGGLTWQRIDAGRDRHYTWGVAVDPDDADCWFISACPGPREAHNPRGNAQAYIYRWRGNGPWQALNGGLPQPLKNFPYALVSIPGHLFAGLSDGRIYVSHDLGDSWQALTLTGEYLPSILAMAYVG
jgi:hypothetical protein